MYENQSQKRLCHRRVAKTIASSLPAMKFFNSNPIIILCVSGYSNVGWSPTRRLRFIPSPPQLSPPTTTQRTLGVEGGPQCLVVIVPLVLLNTVYLPTMTTSFSTSPILQWYLKTQMTFYQDDRLQLPWYFGLLCWSYALAGLALLWMEPQWAKEPQMLLGGRQYPYRKVAALLIMVQSPLSFLADYVHMTNDSYWHVVDRSMALPLMLIELVRVTLVTQQSIQYRQEPGRAMSLSLLGLQFAALLFAAFSFANSQGAQASLHHDGFIFWHNCWHLYPLLATLITLYDFYACGGWKRSTRQYFYRAEVHIVRQTSGVELSKHYAAS
jgi:hypothetical protein